MGQSTDDRAQRTCALLRAREVAGFALDRDIEDVRGWPVYARDGVLVGHVDALLLDIRDRRLRYLSVSLTRSSGACRTGSILVPIGCACREQQMRITVDRLSASELRSAPRASFHRPITRGDERAALEAFGWDAEPNTRHGQPRVRELFDDSGLRAEREGTAFGLRR